MIAASIRLSKENKTENVYEDIKVKVLTWNLTWDRESEEQWPPGYTE